MEIISKELLNEVLDERVTNISEIDEHNNLHYTFSTFNGQYADNDYDSINIYELANKCKEWAFDKKYDFEVIRIKREKDYGKVFIRIHTIHTNKVNGKEFYPFNEEPEAIFKACQWILDNKD